MFLALYTVSCRRSTTCSEGDVRVAGDLSGRRVFAAVAMTVPFAHTSADATSLDTAPT
jgi:hypothetical protein